MNDIDVAGTMDSLIPMLTNYGIRIIGVIFVLWLGLKIANWASTKLTASLRKQSFDETLSIFFGSLVKWGITLAVGLGCLGIFGIETTSFAAVIGAAGLAVGLAFQGTLSNFSAGIMLLVFRPFKVGDLVNLNGQLGIVAEIGLFTTSLDTLDHRRVILPNTGVTGSVIDNFTHHPKRRVDIDVGVDYSADVDQTREVLEAASLRVAKRDAELGHQVIVLSFGASSVDWQVRVWCNTEDYWVTYESTIREIKAALDSAGIGIPFPQMDVHLDGKLDPNA